MLEKPQNQNKKIWRIKQITRRDGVKFNYFLVAGEGHHMLLPGFPETFQTHHGFIPNNYGKP